MQPVIQTIGSFGDVQELVLIHNTVWRGSIGIIELLSESSGCYIAKHPETMRVTGYAFTVRDTRRESVELNDIAVAPEYRRLGHGRALLTHLMTLEQEIRLCADARRSRLLHFYYSLGFRRAAVYENYYGIGRDAYRLVWRAA